MLQIDTLGEPGSGMVHYSPLVAHYFAHIPLCSARPGWAVFVASRSLVRLRGLAPCKTKQAGRHNFVHLHSAELGIDFLEVTVLAFFKTQNSQNRVADMRHLGNLAHVDLETNVSSLNIVAITEMQCSPGSQRFPSTTTSNTAQNLSVGDVFTYFPPPMSDHVNISILVPEHLHGPTDAKYAIQYPSTAISLPFPGIYTIIEDGMTLRRSGATLPSRIKRYLRVWKRIAPASESIQPVDVTMVPLRHLTLIDIMKQSDMVPAPATLLSATVVDGMTTDPSFIAFYNHAQMPACDRSAQWDRHDADLNRSNAFFDSQLPCVLAHPTAEGKQRNITYFQDLESSKTYATYVNANSNYVVDVSNTYYAIFRAGKNSIMALWAHAAGDPALNVQLVYNPVTREEILWQHIAQLTKRSCQDLVPLLQNITNIEDQYAQLVRLLIRNGPCAPGFPGFDILYDPGDSDTPGSECVLAATTAQDTGRDALLVVQRQHTAPDSTHRHLRYAYSAQYLAPTLVRHVFGTLSHRSFCNVRDLLSAPKATSTTFARVALWTVPNNTSGASGRAEAAQIVSSRTCS